MAASLTVSCGRVGFDYTDWEKASVEHPGGAGGMGEAGAPGAGASTSMGGATSGGTPGCAEDCIRVSDGLILLYEFDEGGGQTVFDSGPAEPALDLTIQNESAVTWSESGLSLEAPVAIESQLAATKIADAVSASGELTLEAWLTPKNVTQDGPARVLSVSANENNRNFSLVQQGPTWHMRLLTTQTNENGMDALRSAPIVRTDRQHVVFTHHSDGSEHLYVDGAHVAHSVRPGTMTNWDHDMRAIVGAEFGTMLASRDWQGVLELLAVYERALSPAEAKQNFLAGGGVPQKPCAPDCSERYRSALVYENFENDVPFTWSQGTGTTAVRTTERFHTGEASMLFLQGEQQSEVEVREMIEAVTSGTVYGRAWVYVPANTVTGTIKLMAFVNSGGDARGTDIQILPNGQLRVFSSIEGRNSSSQSNAHPYDAWFCLQTAVQVGDPGGAAYVAVDGITHVEMLDLDTLPFGGINSLIYGLAHTSFEQAGGMVHFDDVVFDTEPVTCD